MLTAKKHTENNSAFELLFILNYNNISYEKSAKLIKTDNKKKTIRAVTNDYFHKQ